MSMVGKVENDKYNGKVNMEKSIDASLCNRFFFSFFLLIVSKVSNY